MKDFEKRIAHLEELAEKMSDPDLPLEKSFGFFEEGVMLARELRKELDELQGKVEILLNSLEVRENDEAEVPNITKFDFQSSESQNDSQDKQAP